MTAETAASSGFENYERLVKCVDQGRSQTFDHGGGRGAKGAIANFLILKKYAKNIRKF